MEWMNTLYNPRFIDRHTIILQKFMIKYYYCETFGPFHKCGSSLILCKNFNAKSRQNRVNTKNTLLRYTVCNMCTSYHRGTDCNHSLSKRSTLVCKRYVCKNEPIHIISWSNCRLDLESKFWASNLSQICLLRPQSWDGDGRSENYMWCRGEAWELILSNLRLVGGNVGRCRKSELS